jgi:glycosidase
MSYDTDFYGNLLDVLQGKKEVAALDYGLRKTFKNYPPNALSLRYLENHDMERFIRQFGAARTRLAAALLLTYPGTPLLLYGQEIGLQASTGQMRWDAANLDLFKFYQLVIQLRRGHPALRSDEILRIPTENPRVYAYLRRAPSETFLIGLNFSGDSVNCSIELPPDLIQFDGPKSPNRVDVISKTTRKLTTHRFELKLAPFQPLIFEICEP